MRVELDEIAGELTDHEVVIGDRTFVAPADLPIEGLVALRDIVGSATIDLRNDPDGALDVMRRFLTVVFGDQTDDLLRLCGVRRLGALLPLVLRLYGIETGEALASSAPSKSTGAPSRPTSNGSTASTSAAPASDDQPTESDFAASPV
jgi:hypothetical protein